MDALSDHLPNRFPAGTRYVVEGRGGQGPFRIHLRYLEFPDGRHVDLPVDPAPRTPARRRRRGTPVTVRK